MAGNIVEYTLKISDDGAKVELRKLKAGAGDLGKELDKTSKKGKEAGSSLRSSFNKVGLAAAAGAAAIAGTTAAVMGLINGLKSFTIEAVDMINDLGDIGNRSGVAADTIGALKAAFHASGQEASQVHQVLDVVAKKLGSLSRGSKAAEEAFEKYGIATKDLEGNLRSNNDILLDSMHVIQGLTDTSLRSRAAVELFGVGGQRLSQALGAGNFDKFLEFVNEFGAVAGPKAAKSAALFQDSLSLQNIAMEGFREELVISLGLMDRFASSMQGVMMFFAGLKEVVVVNKSAITNLFDVGISFANKFLKALNFIFNLGFVPMGEGLQGMAEGIALLGAAMLRHMIKPIAGAIALMSQFAALSDLVFGTKFMESIGQTLKSLSELHDSLDPNTARGFLSFQAFQNGAAKSMKLFGEITGGTKKQASELNSEIEILNKTLDETDEVLDSISNAVGTLNNVLTRLKIPKQLQIGGMQETILEIKGLAQALSDLGMIGTFGNVNIAGRQKSLDMTAQQFALGLDKAAPAIGKAFGVFSGIKAVVSLAEKLGSQGETVAEIQGSVQDRIKERSKAISLGLKAIGPILFETLPPLLARFGLDLIIGLGGLISDLIVGLAQSIKSAFTIGDATQEEKVENAQSFIKAFINAISLTGPVFRSGGKFLPSARAGIRFTGAEDGLAMLHRGEFVVPESGQMSQAVQRNLNSFGSSGLTLNINAAVVEQNAIDELVRMIERRFTTFGQSTSPLFNG